MGLRAILICLYAVGMSTAVLAQGAAPTERDVLEKDFRVMMEWFPGRYDNQEQVYFEEAMNASEDERHERIHHIFQPVKLDGFEGEIFYVQQYQNDDPDQIYRQRIYVFTPDFEEMAIRLSIYNPKDAAALKDAHLDPSKLKGLRKKDLVHRPGCDVFWRRNANQFLGSMKKGACNFVSQRSGKRIVIDDDLILTENEIWISDRAVDEDGAYVFGNKAGIPHKNRKAREFTCWAAVQRRDESYFFTRGVKLHDQGGRASVTTDEDEPRSIDLKMRNVIWPYGRNRPSLVLYVYREGSERADSYVWTEPHGERIALNLRWMQASCTIDKGD